MVRAAITASLLAAAALGACTPHHAVAPPPPPGPAAPGPIDLASLREGVATHGFTPVAVYLDDAGKRLGARLTHAHTGFTFDYLQIDSAPQGYLWVDSFPTSDQGEPHTQEHLLLGKGNRGRALGSAEVMDLATSSAFTEQWRTSYHFTTVAGPAVFWPVLEDQLRALLEPDYTDEEIRREVRNFGVDKADDGALHLEEKGTVYNEMVRAYEAPESETMRAVGQLVYGAKHPLALESGGYPDAIRTMTPADIRRFHDDAYRLGNMGLIGAFPRSQPLAEVLDHTGAILDGLAAHAAAPGSAVMTEATLPPPAGAAPGTIKVVDYPFSDAANPGPLVLAWPATRTLTLDDRVLLGLFLDAFAGDESTTLYAAFVDGKTRTLDVGAQAVWSMLGPDLGAPVYIGLSGVAPAHQDAAGVTAVRATVQAALARLAALPDGDPALVAFDERIRSRITSKRRALASFLDSPPGFGHRGTGSEWMVHLHQLEGAPGFEKSLTERPSLDRALEVIAGGANPWRTRLPAWGLLELPYGVVARPSPARQRALADARAARITAEIARLQAAYHTTDTASTLARYQADYDAQTAAIEAAGRDVPMPPFASNPPMTLDDNLAYTVAPLGGVPTLQARVESMTSTRIGLAFRLDAVPPDALPFLAILPTLLAESGVIEDGKLVPSAEVAELQRTQIQQLALFYDHDLRSGRDELVVEGAGHGVDETRRALTWMQRAMFAPAWTEANLPRLRDLAAQAEQRLRATTQGAEEDWVGGARDAWWAQGSPRYAHTASFMTRAHDVQRLRWMLADPGDAKVTGEVAGFLAQLADAAQAAPRRTDQRARRPVPPLDRAALRAIADALAAAAPSPDPKVRRWVVAAAALSPAARALVRDAGRDLGALLADIPDDALAHDWRYLCDEMAFDLRGGRAAALAGLDAARRAIVVAGNARAYAVGSTANLAAIAPDLTAMLAHLDPTPPVRPTYATAPFVADRLRVRTGATAPRYVGLVDPDTQSGVFLDTAPGASYADTSDDALLDFLSANLYTGHGAHSLFMKTWAAGLAYSNGIHPQVRNARVEWYAERCPLLPQTLRFVIGELKAAKVDPRIADYAIATAFSSRVADGYEDRARAMAADLADGITPEVVRGFRTRLLALRGRADLAAALFARIPAVYGRVMPGLAAPVAGDGAISFVIGPAAQLDAYADYLRAAVGPDATLHRLYPRDFWVPAPVASGP